MTQRIGLEVHVPLDTRAKLFCPCPADAADEPNTNLCPTCTGQPGARPQGVNRAALEHGLHVVHLLGCRPLPDARFQRKHYVYPDLPNNYQRTSTPLGEAGSFWEVGIREAHLEEDPGSYDPDKGLVDLDRSGTPLVEIVTEPDLVDPDQVAQWVRVLRLTLERAGILRPGAELKADVNVSVDDNPRVEVKNVVGGRSAARAAAHELERQRRELDAGGAIQQETRHFDETTGTTRTSRRKETVGDYRYMPDPDLRPLDLAAADPGPPDHADVPDRLRSLTVDLDLELGEALALLEDAALDDLFQRLRQEVPEELAVELCLMRLRAELDYRDATLSALGVDEELLVELARARAQGEVTKQVYTRLLRRALDHQGDVQAELDRERAAGDELDLAAIAERVIQENPDAVEDVRAGNEGALNFLVGQVMKATKGRADAQKARDELAAGLED